MIGKIADIKLLRHYNYEVNQILANSDKDNINNKNNVNNNNKYNINDNNNDSNFYYCCRLSYLNKIINNNHQNIILCSNYLSYLSILIDSIYFDILMDTIILFLGIIILCLPTQDDITLLIIYITIGMLECLMKIIAKGKFRYYRNYRNFVDGLLTLPLVIIIILQLSIFDQSILLSFPKRNKLLRY